MKIFRRFFLLALVFALCVGILPGCAKPDNSVYATCAVPDGLKIEKSGIGKAAIKRAQWDGTYKAAPAAPIEHVTDNWLILVNKTHPLSEHYVPDDMVRIRYLVGDHAESMRYMRSVAAEYFHAMIEAAALEGHEIGIRTAYRSYAQQRDIFNGFAARDGAEAANKYSARPGQSEHQTGLCADVSSPSVNYQMTTQYGDAPEGKWLAEHAHLYGFIIRFPLGKEDITGYQYEPWHVRFVGSEAAAVIYEKGITLEEYLGAVD